MGFQAKLLIRERSVFHKGGMFYHMFKEHTLKWTTGWPRPVWSVETTGVYFLHSSWGDRKNIASGYSTTNSKKDCMQPAGIGSWALWSVLGRIHVDLGCKGRPWEDREGPGTCWQRVRKYSSFYVPYVIYWVCIGWNVCPRVHMEVRGKPRIQFSPTQSSRDRFNFSTAGKLYLYLQACIYSGSFSDL